MFSVEFVKAGKVFAAKSNIITTNIFIPLCIGSSDIIKEMAV
jgi:hypothetical protein